MGGGGSGGRVVEGVVDIGSSDTTASDVVDVVVGGCEGGWSCACVCCCCGCDG